ncbi:apovitellenin-1-like [Sceloporus undulatus]|uniref:apovitellenin-1-like n=1 Tax=Sceloporus undulatus TaxID=8520 RepID=UPI001C4C5BD8|nr:apovitellenin-1-like [Sceloporus undulatus]
MISFKALAVVHILLLGSTMFEVNAKAISKRHVRRDWLIIPDTLAFYLYESVNKVSPKTAAYLAEAVQIPFILEIRNVLIKETSKISVQVEQLVEKISGLWKQEEKETAQQ